MLLLDSARTGTLLDCFLLLLPRRVSYTLCFLLSSSLVLPVSPHDRDRHSLLLLVVVLLLDPLQPLRPPQFLHQPTSAPSLLSPPRLTILMIPIILRITSSSASLLSSSLSCSPLSSSSSHSLSSLQSLSSSEEYHPSIPPIASRSNCANAARYEETSGRESGSEI